jgi:hypothetical protein
MKKIFIYVILMLLLVGCTEKKQDYFNGIVSEIADDYIIVIPDEDEPIKKLGDKVYVTKELMSTRGIPHLEFNERVRILYNKAEKDKEYIRLKTVFAIYKESEID